MLSAIRQVYKNPLYMNRLLCFQRKLTDDQGKQPSAQSGTYQAAEYYSYNEYSFNDIQIDMDKYRLPRPTSKTSNDDKK